MCARCNVFRLCAFLRVLGHFMVFVVLGIMGLIYYSVVVETLGPGMSSTDEKLKAYATGLLAGAYSLNVFMIVWSYFATVLTDPGRVPEDWHPFVDEAVAEVELQRWMQFGDSLYDRSDPRRPRVSQRCILKMDHYCIWVVNCVGLLNYKFFILFLFYTLLGTVFSASILLSPLIDNFTEGDPSGSPVFFLSFILDVAFAVSLLAFLAMHVKLMAHNCTSIEMYEKQRIDPWPFDRGARSNFHERRSVSSYWMQYSLPDFCLAIRSELVTIGFE